MTLHKLTAGDGYTYLTRQVAAHDASERGLTGLGAYYEQRGESPGVWLGSGLVGLPHFLPGPVSEAQMRALFGEGRHPDADRLERGLIAEGWGAPAALRATRLGQPFAVSDATNPFRSRLAEAFEAHNAARGVPRDWPVPAEQRATIRTRIAQEVFAAEYGRGPIEARELSGFIARVSRQATTAVAGYDLTFSPVKSVSTLWAIAPRETADAIAQAHADAVSDTIGWLERRAVYTREGRGGVRQVETRGVIAAAFTHRDSRSGDPDLHTHVAISNKVQTTTGRWLALDGRPLHQQAVAASEHYNTRLEALLRERLGVRFADRAGTPVDKRPVREIVGVDPRLSVAWSQRRAAIDTRRAELAAQFQRDHGRVPTPVEAIALAQQANLETRQHKHAPRSLAEHRTTWRREASAVLGSVAAIEAMVRGALSPAVKPAAPRHDLHTWVENTGLDVLDRVQQSRSSWQDSHVRAEAERRARTAEIPAVELDTVVDQLVDAVLARSIPLGTPDDIDEAAELRRSDGRSVYSTAHTQLYTSPAILHAERELIDAAGRRDGLTLDPTHLDLALLESTANGLTLTPAQQQLVGEFTTSGARLQLALAPAGTGKTTALRVVSRAWQSAAFPSGPGRVIGLAPSAAAAAVLRQEADLPSDTIAKFLHDHDHEAAGVANEPTLRVDPATLIIVDEAGMAGTLDLARVLRIALRAGASVRFVGDTQQLAAIAAGGVLRDIADTHGAVELSQVLRFADPAEGAASLALRTGDPAAIGFYLDAGRVHVGDLTTVTEQAYQAWAADRARCLDSVMLAPTQDLVTALNTRARTDRLTHAAMREGRPEVQQVGLADGTAAGAGDVILTRRNNRRLPITATDWVKNGDRFTVASVADDGSVQVIHHGTRRRVTLPADYAANHVSLGYASTVHSAQGLTADTAHTVVTGTETRHLLYVAATRARHANHLYLATTGDGDPHTVINRDTLIPPTAADILTRVLARTGDDASATSLTRALADPATRLADAAARYDDALTVAAETHLGAEALTALTGELERIRPGVTDQPAWATLRGHLALLAAAGHDPIGAARTAATTRGFEHATDTAAVLDWRLSSPPPTVALGADAIPVVGVAGPLPWLPHPPDAIRDQRWRTYLHADAQLVRDLADQVRATAHAWTSADAPAWARPLLDQPHRDDTLLPDLAVWRAANRVDADDYAPAGPRPRYATEAACHDTLLRRVERVIAPTDTRGFRDLATRIDPRLVTDPYWPQLTLRLTAIAQAGVDITSLALNVAEAGPLPDEHPAAALWWRLARHLTPPALTNGPSRRTTLHPPWTSDLIPLIGDTTTSRVLADTAWPALVAAVTIATEHGWTPSKVLTTATGLITNLDHMSVDQITSALIWQISTLTDPPDPSHLTEHDLHTPARASIPVPARELDLLGATDAPHDAQWLATAHPSDDEPPQPAHTPPSSGPRPDLALTGAESPRDVIRERLLELNQQAFDYYQDQYPRSWAPAYLQQRLHTDLADTPALQPGYAPSGWTHALEHLRHLGATDTELLAVGLATRTRTGGLIDRFRDRLVFPVRSQEGISGFIARRNPALREDYPGSGPKYLNTAATALFTKGAHLYGLDETRHLLDAGATPVLCEGPLDALAVTLAGDTRYAGIAALGTAFTDTQADQLTVHIRGHAPPPGIIVALDNDTAGQAASARAYWQLTARHHTPRHLRLPERQDPADVLRLEGPQALRTHLDQADDLATHLIDTVLSRYASRLDTAEGTVAAIRAAADIAGAADPQHWPNLIEHIEARVHAFPGTVHLAVIEAGTAHPHNAASTPTPAPSSVRGETPANDNRTRSERTRADLDSGRTVRPDTPGSNPRREPADHPSIRNRPLQVAHRPRPRPAAGSDNTPAQRGPRR